jgi:hypothetical protein
MEADMTRTNWPPTVDVARETGHKPVSPLTVRREQLDLDLIETEVTHDHVDDDGVFIQPPPGHGWRVLDAHRSRHTTWIRRRPVARVWKGRRTC